jgi:hypothetical protein
MSDNPAPTTTVDNTATQTQAAPASTPAATPDSFSWKNQLAPDFANSPTMQKFSDDKSGFNEAVKSHLSLEQLLGHEKVPVPKGPEDTEGWNRFAKAMGVPDKADGYALPDAQVPDNMKALQFNKQEFAEMAHALKFTPGQTKALWDTYTAKAMDSYGKALKAHEAKMTDVVNRLRGEWGDSYDTNVELGQMVINKFSGDKETNDFVTSVLSQDPRGIKFLKALGDQFAENRLPEFSIKRFSLSPDQAQAEIDEIVNDPNHPYNNDKASPAERQKAIDYVNGLYAAKNKARG